MRTTTTAVKAILGNNYDADAATDVTPYIDTASSLVDQVAACANRKGVILSAGQLELIERWMSAHYYTQMDPLYKSRTTLSASGTFAEQSYKEVAVDLDPSGCLNALLKRLRGRVEFVGMTPDEREVVESEGL